MILIFKFKGYYKNFKTWVESNLKCVINKSLGVLKITSWLHINHPICDLFTVAAINETIFE